MRVNSLEKYTDEQKTRESRLVSKDEFDRVCGDLRLMVAGLSSQSKLQKDMESLEVSLFKTIPL